MAVVVGQTIIPFRLPGVDGHEYGSDSYPDAPALAVIFWCNHCPYVRAWEDRVIALARAYGDRKVRMLLINSNDPRRYPDDSFEQMKVRARDKAYPVPYLFDATQEVARAYGATRTPEIFLFDRAHALRYHGAPDDNVEDPRAVQRHYFRDALEAVLQGETPGVPETPPRGCTIKWK